MGICHPISTFGRVPGHDARFIAHRAGVERLLASYRGLPPGTTVRLAKKTSNLFRTRADTAVPGLDVGGLAGIIAIEPDRMTADVGGMTTYEDLVAATLPYGLSPLVVPQLKTITVGGAVTGIGIESSSFRNGLPHESVLEIDVLTGAGEIVTAKPAGAHADLFHGFPNSYGTLGYSTRLRIRLEPVRPYVALRHLRFRELSELVSAIDRIVAERSHGGERVDYLDGVVFGRDESYLTLGRQTDEPGPVSDYTGMAIYYQSIRTRDTDRLTIHDYLWRWDTDWFWCSRYFGAQHPFVRRCWPKRYLRSSVYWKLIALNNRYHIADRLRVYKGGARPERVIQDIEVPIERTAEFLDWFLSEIPIEPVWLCPVRLCAPSASGTAPWPLYPIPAEKTYVNVGFWSTVPTAVDAREGAMNREIEGKVADLDGHKSLYSEAFYEKVDFDRLYGGHTYTTLKKRYDPENRLLDLYAKVVERK
ncbi:FAD-binding oxidoreductase [Nocardia vinacea]|nr:FAD-binding oxidoreductase [Nocardia vinacea]